MLLITKTSYVISPQVAANGNVPSTNCNEQQYNQIVARRKLFKQMSK